MKKVAIFVEGMTEQRLLIALVSEMVGRKNIHFELAEQFRGCVSIKSTAAPIGVSLFVLIVDCKGDEQVKTQIRNQYQSLVAAGYSAIIGLRDVYPHDASKVDLIQSMLLVGLPSGPVVPIIHLAVMEVEAWFLAEVTHFQRIHPDLTLDKIINAGLDVESTPPEAWAQPAKVLDEIYRLVQSRYLTNAGAKRRNRVDRTIGALSFDELYGSIRYRVPAMMAFFGSIEAAIF